jgi:hypothetical protein
MGSTWWYQTGVTLTVLTSPPGRVVGLDGNEVGISDSGGKFVLERAPRKNHTLSAAHEGYQSQALTEPIGPFAFNAKVPLIMQQQTYRMTAQTRPPSSNVYVDDKLAGKSDVIALVIGIAGIAIIIPIGGLLLAHDDLKENAAATLGVVLLNLGMGRPRVAALDKPTSRDGPVEANAGTQTGSPAAIEAKII